jgi:OOP family OmpA-OmpF porin
VLSLAGCVKFEHLIKVPVQPEMTTVQGYNTELHRQSIHIFNPVALDNRVDQLRLEPRIDNLFFLVDQSSALSDEFRGVEMKLYAREMVRRFVRTMPDKKYNGALLINTRKSGLSGHKLHLMPYSTNNIELALDSEASTIRVETSSLVEALDQLTQLMSRIKGRSAVILVTSWSQVNKDIEKSVMRMRQRSRYSGGMEVVDSSPEFLAWQGTQSGVCFYTLGVGNRFSRTRLETVDSCGFSVAADKVAQPRDMAHFVQSVLYRGPADTDGDGIYDYKDHCPNTSAGRIVDYSGCPRFVAKKGEDQGE